MLELELPLRVRILAGWEPCARFRTDANDRSKINKMVKQSHRQDMFHDMFVQFIDELGKLTKSETVNEAGLF